MESLEKYKVKTHDIHNNNYKKNINQSYSKSNNKIEHNINKDSSKKIKPDENKNKSDKKKSFSEQNKSEHKNKDILNKKRNREEVKKEPKKKVEKKNYISDEEFESDSEDKSYHVDQDNESSSSESYSESSNHSAKKIKSSSKPKSKPKKESENASTKKTTLKPKGSLVYDLLERWWYALPTWPPENYDTSEKLKENKLRLVKISDWKKEPKLDKDNYEKCFELPGFKYVYLNTDGKVFDLRPEEGKPSYNNLKKLSDVKLSEYLVKALKNQLDELEKRNSVLEKELRKNIKEKLDKAERNLARLKK